jgi:hypothetical protein
VTIVFAYTDAQIDNKIANLKSQLDAAKDDIASLKTRIANPTIKTVVTFGQASTSVCPEGYKIVACYLAGDNGVNMNQGFSGVAGPYGFTVQVPVMTPRSNSINMLTSGTLAACQCATLGLCDISRNQCTAVCLKI